DEAILWHRRLGHVNFKNINKLVKGNLVRGLPSKSFKHDHSCLACRKGKQHKASLDLARCDHETEFKNQLMNEFCTKKGIKREYSIARTPQQNGVAERKNRTLIEAARTMLADLLLPIQFWAEAVNTACYVLNRVLVTKPQMKTPYEFLMGKPPNISFMKPFGYPLTILNTINNLGKFNGKSEEGYLLGYSTNSKGFRVYNKVTRKVQDCLHVDFFKDQRLDFEKEKRRVAAKKIERAKGVSNLNTARLTDVFQSVANTPFQSAASTPTGFFEAGQSSLIDVTNIPDDPNMPGLEDTDDELDDEGIFKGSSFDDKNSSNHDSETDFNNMDNTIDVSSTPTLRIHKNHPPSQIIGPSTAGVQTRRKVKEGTFTQHQALLSFVYKQNRTNHKDQQTCLFACFLSQEEPKKVLCDLPAGKRVIGTKWVFMNKRDERGTVIKNKARLVAQGYRQEEGVDYDEVFAPVAHKRGLCHTTSRRGAIDKTLFIKRDRKDIMWFHVLLTDITSLGLLRQPWLTEIIEELMQRSLHEFIWVNLTFFLGLQVKQITAGIFISQDKYVKDILNKFDFRTIKPATTPIEAHKALGKDEEEAFSDSDYAGDNHDRRLTSGGCQYLGRRLVSGSAKETNNCSYSSTEADMYQRQVVVDRVGFEEMLSEIGRFCYLI
ncbi:putative ribonuclease H-like domain-containing protein, partial [Tanacetum coccineum]